MDELSTAHRPASDPSSEATGQALSPTSQREPPPASPRAPAPRLPWWQRPVLGALLITGALLLAVIGWTLVQPPMGASLPGAGAAGRAAEQGLPWQVVPDGQGGSQVFGLRLGAAPGGMTLGEVMRHFADDMSVAVIAPMGTEAAGQPLALEAYAENFRAGFITGKLVMAFEADPAWLAQARSHSPGNDVSEGGRSRRHKLHPDDQAAATRARLVALAFVPAARLDEAVVVQRFGKPTERLSGASGELHLLYPAAGVAVMLPPTEGDGARAKPLIQYVAPERFETGLRAPLRAEAASAAASAGG